MLILSAIIIFAVIFTVLHIVKNNNMPPKERRARELAKRARHLNGKQLLGFLSTYAQDEEEMRRALEILSGKK